MAEARARSRRSVPAGIARHGRLRKSHGWATGLKVVAAGAAVLLVSGASLSAIAIGQLQGNIDTVTLPGQTQGPIPAIGSYEGGFNMVLIGSDTRVGSGEVGPESTLNDVTMLVHVAEDQSSATVVSIPRDLLTPIPACTDPDTGQNYPAVNGQQINASLARGGVGCTVSTVAALTGLQIQYAGLITFSGVIAMSDAIGGVDVCVNGPYYDSYTQLRFPAAGTYSLQGRDAELFLRSRHAVGDGGDLGRISSQQIFLSSLARKVQDEQTLTNLPALFAFASAATDNMVLSDGLGNLNTLVSMALVFRDIPLDRITFVQFPVVSGTGSQVNRLLTDRAPAAELLARIAADEPFTPSGTGVGSEAPPEATPSATPSETALPTTDPEASVPPADPSVTPTPSPSTSPSADVIPGVLGQTAATQTCSVVNN